MKFKVDENLPVDFVRLLRLAEHDAVSVVEQDLKGASDRNIIEVCKKENRILVTLDLGFANLQTYSPVGFPGLMVLRPHKQSKTNLIQMFRHAIPFLAREELKGHLWIVEESQIRIHGRLPSRIDMRESR